jgi:hypothetical protein
MNYGIDCKSFGLIIFGVFVRLFSGIILREKPVPFFIISRMSTPVQSQLSPLPELSPTSFNIAHVRRLISVGKFMFREILLKSECFATVSAFEVLLFGMNEKMTL